MCRRLLLLCFWASSVYAEETFLTEADFNRITPEINNRVPPRDEDAIQGDKVEGDMVLKTDLEEYVAYPELEARTDISYNAIKSPLRKWAGGVVPYAIHPAFDREDRAIIAAGMKEIMDKTCIKFVPHRGQKDHVFVFRKGGCWSMIGRQGGRQMLSLGSSGCMYKGIVAHELMHAIGFFHEQSRADRNDYVTVVEDNVMHGKLGNFRMYSLKEIRHLGTEYDYDSLMHYGEKDFSKNGRKTLIPKDSNAEIGQRRGLSENDALKINRFYQCENTVIPTATPKPVPVKPTRVPPRVTTRRPSGECKDQVRNCRGLKDFCHKLEIQHYCMKTCDKCDGLVGVTKAPKVTQAPKPTQQPGGQCKDAIRNCRGLRDFCHKSSISSKCRNTCGKC